MSDPCRRLPDDPPSRQAALELLRDHGTDRGIIAHCRAVESLAAGLAGHALSRGWPIDIRLVRAGALLHDIERARGRDHARYGCELLRELGCPRTAAVVGIHMDLPAGFASSPGEGAIVYLADKMVMGERRVGLKMRMELARAVHGGDPEALAGAIRRLDDALRIQHMLGLDDQRCLLL